MTAAQAGRPDQADQPLCVGLHIAKCAGTSLITTLRRTLSEDEHYFYSSYYSAWRASRPSFADIVALERLRIVFGHYCHETLLSVFANRSVFLFTGLREPLARAVSGFRQLNATLEQAGRDPVSADAYLAEHANPTCAELLRCMPSLAGAPGAIWQRARACLGLFDFVYDTERFDEHAMVLFDVLGLPRSPLDRDNISASRPLPPAIAAYVQAETETIVERDREFLGEDMRLWDAMRPHLGRPWMRAEIATERWLPDRARFVAALPPPAEARRIFAERERDFLLHEFDVLGELDALRRSCETRVATAQAMLARLDTV